MRGWTQTSTWCVDLFGSGELEKGSANPSFVRQSCKMGGKFTLQPSHEISLLYENVNNSFFVDHDFIIIARKPSSMADAEG